MMLTQDFTRALLSLGFNMPLQYIVPKQGNWFNVIDNMMEGFKVDTWIAFEIKEADPKTIVYYDPLTDGSGNVSTVNMFSDIEVQLVGLQAEYGAQSMAHWGHRSDIENFLMASGMALIPGGLGKYIRTNFKQDGANTVWAYNAKFTIHWLSEISSQQQILTQVILPSGIITINASGNVNITN